MVADTVAFITGASRGVGRTLALALAADGSRVAAFARGSEDLDSLRAEPGSIVPIATDVTDPHSVTTSFARATGDVGPPTLLVTCAGSIDALGPIATVDPEEWWRSVTVDVRGTMLSVRAVAASMIERRAGRIVTVYGNLGDDGREHVSAFAAAKAATARFTETLATELEGTGVVALCMHPGFVRTPMTQHLASSPDGRRWIPEFGERAPGRWGDGQPAVDLARRIIAGEADRLTGRVVHVGDDLAELSELAAEPQHGDLRRLRIRTWGG